MATNTKPGRAACRRYESLLEDYIQGELNAADADQVVSHVKQCAGCRDALDQAQVSVRLLRSAQMSADPGPEFSRIVMARIHASERQNQATDRVGFWQPIVSMGWRFAATATLAFGVLLTYDVRWAPHPQPNASATRLIGVSDIFAPDPARPPADRDEVLMMVAETNHGQ